MQNVKGAFQCRRYDYFEGKRVLLVDDVLTTMSTVSEAARVVEQAGAARVCIVALAR